MILCRPFVPVRRLVGAVVLAVLAGGCDQSPEISETVSEPPRVADLQIVPDSIHASDVPDGQVEDSLAQIPLSLSSRASDPEGAVARVVFTLEPSANPQAAAFGTLSHVDSNLYRSEVTLGVPVNQDEIYTIRVFAIDDDSLASNQVTGQFRFVPEQ